jgi:hypothetical protein
LGAILSYIINLFSLERFYSVLLFLFNIFFLFRFFEVGMISFDCRFQSLNLLLIFILRCILIATDHILCSLKSSRECVQFISNRDFKSLLNLSFKLLNCSIAFSFSFVLANFFRLGLRRLAWKSFDMV